MEETWLLGRYVNCNGKGLYMLWHIIKYNHGLKWVPCTGQSHSTVEPVELEPPPSSLMHQNSCAGV